MRHRPGKGKPLSDKYFWARPRPSKAQGCRTARCTVVRGYTLHVENVCVEPSLLALYRACNDAGRGELPALRGSQPLGRARGNEIGVAIRDAGTFLDPRLRQDWWPRK